MMVLFITIYMLGVFISGDSQNVLMGMEHQENMGMSFAVV